MRLYRAWECVIIVEEEGVVVVPCVEDLCVLLDFVLVVE